MYIVSKAILKNTITWGFYEHSFLGTEEQYCCSREPKLAIILKERQKETFLLGITFSLPGVE